MLGDKVELADPFMSPSQVVCRFYRYEWLIKAYEPMAALETALTGDDVQVAGPPDFVVTVTDEYPE